jgi:hypothetical protein
MNLLTFLHLQIERILAKPQVHSPGPRKPSLQALDLKKPKP